MRSVLVEVGAFQDFPPLEVHVAPVSFRGKTSAGEASFT